MRSAEEKHAASERVSPLRGAGVKPRIQSLRSHLMAVGRSRLGAEGSTLLAIPLAPTVERQRDYAYG
jgi:hypothetical protein